MTKCIHLFKMNLGPKTVWKLSLMAKKGFPTVREHSLETRSPDCVLLFYCSVCSFLLFIFNISPFCLRNYLLFLLCFRLIYCHSFSDYYL